MIVRQLIEELKELPDQDAKIRMEQSYDPELDIMDIEIQNDGTVLIVGE